jgi:hypothetical protein
MRITLALTATLGALVLASGAVGKRPATTVCTGTVTGVVARDLIVPRDASCDASGAIVKRRVLVRRDAILKANAAFNARRSIDVARGATLQLIGTKIVIGGRVDAHGAKKVALIREPLVGSSGTIGGSVQLSNTGEVSVLSLTIRGKVVVRGGGGEGLEVGASRMRSLDVSRARMLHPQHPRVISIHSNTVGGNVGVSNNDATGAISPLFIGGNTLLKGSLTCRGNVPAPVNSGPGGTEPNVVNRGKKRGQCASL